MQISDELVRHIANELMKRIGSSSPASHSKQILHLTGSREDLSTPALATIQKSFDIYEHRNWDDPLPSDVAVLITSLSVQALVRVAEGDEGCTVEGRVLLSALLNGQAVAVLKDGLVWRRYMETAPKVLLNRYAHCEKVLQSYGVRLVTEDEVVSALSGRRQAVDAGSLAAVSMPSKPLPEAAPSFVRPSGGRRVISEADIMSACPVANGFGQTMHLSANDILTPLARDYALARKINLITA